MTLTLQIENMTSLPDGGPLSVSIKGERGLDIGRDPYLDWTLPDPNRFISGRHCEVRWHDGAYWLHDISTNGTFLNGTDSRLKGPHRLRNGDRFVIGHYVIAASLDDEEAPVRIDAPRPASPANDDLWGGIGDAAAPIDPQQLKAAREAAPVRPDFLDWAVDLPSAELRPAAAKVDQSPAAMSGVDGDNWAMGPAPRVAAPPAEIAPVPTPRRVDSGAGPAAGRPAAVQPPQVVAAAARGRADEEGAEARDVPPPRRFGAVPAAEGAPEAAFVECLARGAGLPAEFFAGQDPARLAEQLGRLLKLATVNMAQLLEARQQAKRSARSISQTTIQAVDNNPLKFAPTPEDALRIMFNPQGRGYLDAEKAFQQGFDDLKTHQIRTYAAMQQAILRLLEELDPAAIDAASPADHGLAAMVGSRKARLWDIYVARWQAHAQHDHGLLDTFMSYFARCYDGS